MTTNRSLLLLASGEAGFWDSVAGYFQFLIPGRRAKYRRFAAVSLALRTSLADPDEDASVKINLRRDQQLRRFATTSIFLVLTSLAAYEWLSYMAPGISGWVHRIVTHC